MYAAQRGPLVGFFGSLAAMVANWSGGKAVKKCKTLMPSDVTSSLDRIDRARG